MEHMKEPAPAAWIARRDKWPEHLTRYLEKRVALAHKLALTYNLWTLWR